MIQSVMDCCVSHKDNCIAYVTATNQKNLYKDLVKICAEKIEILPNQLVIDKELCFIQYTLVTSPA